MRVSTYKDKVAMIASIIDPHHFVLWAAYVDDRIEEGKSFEEAVAMGDYNFKKDIELARSKADLILKLLEE